ncbi:MAG: amino acid transport protein [Pseudomonadota bacterium]|nr:amino acid transport protein [Pseudomonadota bacterium]
MDNQTSLFLGLFFGSIGIGYALYGKKQKKGVPFICGIGLMIFPYLISNIVLFIAVGCLFLIIPYFLRY